MRTSPADRQTYATEVITFPHTTYTGGKNNARFLVPLKNVQKNYTVILHSLNPKVINFNRLGSNHSNRTEQNSSYVHRKKL